MTPPPKKKKVTISLLSIHLFEVLWLFKILQVFVVLIWLILVQIIKYPVHAQFARNLDIFEFIFGHTIKSGELLSAKDFLVKQK